METQPVIDGNCTRVQPVLLASTVPTVPFATVPILVPLAVLRTVRFDDTDTAIVLPVTNDAVGVVVAVEVAPAPLVLFARTVNVYVVPFVSPVTVADLELVVTVLLPGAAVTVYEVIALPPFEAGVAHETFAFV